MDTTQKRVDECGEGETPREKNAGGKVTGTNKDDVLNGILRRIGGSSRGEVVNDGQQVSFYPEGVLDVENLDVPLENQGIE